MQAMIDEVGNPMHAAAYGSTPPLPNLSVDQAHRFLVELDLADDRAEMAAFLLRTEHGPGWTPPSPTGTVFGDVPLSHWAAGWIEALASEGITLGCDVGRYCPEAPVSRAEMAVFLTRTFRFTLH